MKSISGFALRVAAAMLVASASAHAQDLGIEVGATAPGAAVETLDGKPANLSQYVGKSPVLIEFWATWCGNCKELEPAMKAAHKKFGDRVKFVGVSVSVNQSPQRVKLYIEKYGMPGDQYFDRKGDATVSYDVPATSYVVVLDAKGKVVYTGLGGQQNLDAALTKAVAR